MPSCCTQLENSIKPAWANHEHWLLSTGHAFAFVGFGFNSIPHLQTTEKINLTLPLVFYLQRLVEHRVLND
jgi:hypothetical protein